MRRLGRPCIIVVVDVDVVGRRRVMIGAEDLRVGEILMVVVLLMMVMAGLLKERLS